MGSHLLSGQHIVMVILFTRGWKEDYIVNGLDELKLDDTANTQR